MSDIGDALTTPLTATFGIQFANIFACDLNLATGDATAGARIDHGGKTDRRFASAGFTDKSNNFATLQFKRHIVDKHRA